MFNTTNNSTRISNNLNINAVNGTILKSYPKSFFKRFHLKSDFAKSILNEYPMMDIHEENGGAGARFSNYKPVVILQMMMCGDMDVIAEIMLKKDFDELFENNAD
ncbi:hypothetical protein [Clostridium neonatale]|uniref:hypothetical protein n=1 Tax=Clostridium neonatale TaxID=137838 RepID=UPI00291B4BC6|nr:hypothetical protein [Clostridium neonatale]CAI3587087.1 conserved hypothetical protein [Clostridium neonatale]CAI3590217.1 conserved hypothetical protein [Clostridium neonatale]CAI3652180.1 conserved hypothetical protein [Clostridium neonatale]CAI3709758.1 conserved hypothetical protein [Clostridium neonatale]CAI3709850.1 conserved hypothetical protein [Clostridium neonatale]